MNWVDSAEGSDYWRTLVNATLDLWVQLAKGLVILVHTLCFGINNISILSNVLTKLSFLNVNELRYLISIL